MSKRRSCRATDGDENTIVSPHFRFGSACGTRLVALNSCCLRVLRIDDDNR
jgi:hypothetical protein